MNNQIQIVLKSSTTEMSLNDHEAGIYIIPDLDGLTGLPEIRTTSGVNAGYDGGWTTAQNYDARSITLRGVIANSDVATVERLRKQLVTLLGQGKNEQLIFDIVTQAGNAYELMVRTIECEMAMQRVLTQQEFMIQLRADDPLIYDNTAGSESVLVQVQRAIGGFEINFELPLAISGGSGESVIENAGLEKVYPVIKMYGELHNPIFVNLTTNQQIQLNTNLAFADGDTETKSGNPINISNAVEAPLNAVSIYGNTSQTGTPTPSSPIQVQTVSGEQTISLNGDDYKVELASKNLFNKDKTPDNYYYNNSGTTTSDGANAFVNQEFTDITKMAISWSSRNGASAYVRVCEYEADGTFIKRTLVSTNNTILAMDANTWKVITCVDAGPYFSFTDLQIERGDSITDFVPYFEPIELCKIGDYQDYIYKDGSDWKKHSAIGKVTLDGTESGWTKPSTNRFNIDNYVTGYTKDTGKIISLCSQYPTLNSTGDNGSFNSIASSRSYALNFNSNQSFNTVRFKNTDYDNLDNFKTALGTNPVTVYYALSTTTDTTITNSALIEQLEAVLAANTQTGVNSITLTPSLGETGSLTVTYYTSSPKRDEVIIDSRKRTVTLNGTDIYHLIADGSEFPILAPGENKLVLHSDITGDNGYAEVNYKQGYLSI